MKLLYFLVLVCVAIPGILASRLSATSLALGSGDGSILLQASTDTLNINANTTTFSGAVSGASFTATGSDYQGKQGAYISLDAEGKFIPTGTSPLLTEFDNIANLFKQEYNAAHSLDGSSVNVNTDTVDVLKIYLPAGTPAGTWSSTVEVYIVYLQSATRYREKVKFSSYPGNTEMTRTTQANIVSAVQIYNDDSPIHPNQTPPASLYSLIYNHFKSDYDVHQHPDWKICNVGSISAQAGWTLQSQFFVNYAASYNGAACGTLEQNYKVELYGSPSGYNAIPFSPPLSDSWITVDP